MSTVCGLGDPPPTYIFAKCIDQYLFPNQVKYNGYPHFIIPRVRQVFTGMGRIIDKTTKGMRMMETIKKRIARTGPETKSNNCEQQMQDPAAWNVMLVGSEEGMRGLEAVPSFSLATEALIFDIQSSR
mmetsp:Transcript_11978/g.17859  ORF Transcript_11978/g.17859 Transcript_11978/m.17859 type:complete len:128 (-) Transcript_11978:66-449(-)